MEIFIEYLAIWAPSLVSILGVATTIIIAINKVVTAYNNLNKDETLKEIRNQLNESIRTNKELNEKYDLLLDQLTRIKDYSKNKKGE